MGAFGILFCSDFKRLFILSFTQLCVLRPFRPTLMGALGIIFCNDFKRLFYFSFHTAVCFGLVHHDGKEKNKNSFEIVAK